ncbi:hypothetical protein M9H77_30537 [Catharanthus roseus]|uniref:Uncharacterized protein n=1 Tax=Catharanthus roseus TaxID=4058 RepID=A0ACB9ZXI2_CATRO|nr:hypothetical protein M9H77_30537 [Catharanthus roseus]
MMSPSREESCLGGSRVVRKSFNVDKNIIIIISLTKKSGMPNHDFTFMNSLVSIFSTKTPCTTFAKISHHLQTFKALRSVKEVGQSSSEIDELNPGGSELLRSKTFEVTSV